MDKETIIKKIEDFAPIELAEEWDASGWICKTSNNNISKILLCLTVTDKIIEQAKIKNCDMIISHHPLFYVPISYKDVDIYCAHTNMDKANGGTTDKLIQDLKMKISEQDEFVRYCDNDISVENFSKMLCNLSKNVRIINNKNITQLHKIAFCAGSGSEFIKDATIKGADAFVTGDIKFHTAIESDIVLFDIGHFESEIGILKVFEKLIPSGIEVIFAEEKSPFKSL